MLTPEILRRAVENIRKFYRYIDGVYVPLSYRVFGFPCSIDAGPGRNERIDSTWMTEDVALITNFLRERRASPGIGRKHLNEKNRQQQLENIHFPASVVFDTYDEIKELLEPPSHFSSEQQALSTIVPNQYKFRCSSVLKDTTCPFDGNGVMFIYLTGHGLSAALAKNLSDPEANVKTKIIRDKRYSMATTNFGRLNEEEELAGGELIAYITLLSIGDFISEFAAVCDPNAVVSEQLGAFFEPEPPFKHRHLIILVDACFAGHWIVSLDHRFSSPFIKDTHISITIQTSTDDDTCSYGYFFTPLFVKLQNLNQIDLDQCVHTFMNTNDKQQYVKEIQQFPQFLYFKTDLNEEDGKMYLRDHENDWKDSLYFTVHNLRFFVNKEFFAYFAHQYKYELLETDTDRVPRPVLDNDEGQQFLEMLIAKKMAIRGMKLTQYDRNKTPLCIIVIRSKTNQFMNTQNVLSSRDEYWYHLHVHYDGNDRFPGAITYIKLVYAVQDELKYFEKSTYLDASNDEVDDYENISKQKVNEAVGNWKQYREDLEKCLKNWVKCHKNGLKIWESKGKWNRANPARLGNVAVRDRSRYLVTQDIDITKLKDKITQSDSESTFETSDKCSSDDSNESIEDSVPISIEKIFALPDGKQLFLLIFMLNCAHLYSLSEKDIPLFEKSMLTWLHSCGITLPSIGKYMVQHGTSSAKFSARRMFRKEILPLLGYTAVATKNSDTIPVNDLKSLSNLHVLGLTLFHLRLFFPIDFNIELMDITDEKCTNIDDALESDPTYISKQLWNDLDSTSQQAIKTKFDRWQHKMAHKTQVLLVQLKFGNSGTVLAAPHGNDERFVIWADTNHTLEERYLDNGIFPLIDAWRFYCHKVEKHNKRYKRDPAQQQLKPKTLFDFLRMTVPESDTLTFEDS